MNYNTNLLPLSALPDDLTRESGTYASAELSRVLNMACGGQQPETDKKELGNATKSVG